MPNAKKDLFSIFFFPNDFLTEIRILHHIEMKGKAQENFIRTNRDGQVAENPVSSPK